MRDNAGLVQFVNILQGTDSHHGFSTGNTLPIVACPFGMNHWSVQTDDSSNWFFSPRQRTFQGIRCTHQPSPWMGDYGHFTISCNTGQERHLSPRRRARSYDADFQPHLLNIDLLNDGTSIRMSPTTRGAFFEFTFPDGAGRVIVEPCTGDSEVVQHSDDEFCGWVNGNSGGVPEGFRHYFAIRTSRACRTFSPFRANVPTNETAGERLGFFLEFDGSVDLQIATSFISVEQAFLNLDQELSGKSFDEIVEAAETAWEDSLGTIVVDSEDEDRLATFYSCFYRTQLFPRIWHEVAGDGSIQHRSPYDGQVHAGVLYTDNGFWDTYRTVYPLLGTLQPDRLKDILQGWTNAYKEGGWFPQWATPGYRACMVGTHIDAVMADAVARGVTEFDLETAYEGLRKHAFEIGHQAGAWGRIGIEDYKRLGYVSNDSHESVARSLDYAYDDWCIAQVAKHLGKPAEDLISRADTYKNLYDPEVGFMRAKDSSGNWQGDWNEFHWGSPYVEGGPWQSSWAVPHDAAGLIQLNGGDDAFVAKLDRLLALPPYYTTGAYGMEIHEMTEMAIANFGQYAHSNQPVHQVLYLYNSAGKPWRTQAEVRRVMDELYTPDDLPGDEDNGEMSAWYVLSSLGLYPLTPGHPSWTLGTPLFSKATVTLPNGKTLVITADDWTETAFHVSSVTLNGTKLNRLYLTQKELAAGGTLNFKMTEIPIKKSVPPEGRPYSMSTHQ